MSMANILDVVGKVARMEARSAEAILNSEAGQSGALPGRTHLCPPRHHLRMRRLRLAGAAPRPLRLERHLSRKERQLRPLEMQLRRLQRQRDPPGANAIRW
jgi:hypothetical protein